MSMPGFAAEASLGPQTRMYRMSADIQAAERGVVPQIVWMPGDACIPNCVCFSPVNCPCCSWTGPRGPWPVPNLPTAFASVGR
jgi:hypothetical protein